jgi:hypothetical protein
MGLLCSTDPWSGPSPHSLTHFIPLSVVCLFLSLSPIALTKNVLNLNPCDWRVSLCVTNGYSDLSPEICIYDGKRLSEQLDSRCHDILSKKIRIDSNPPSLLTSTPSITLPKSLSCLIPIPSSSNGTVSPGPDSSRNSSSPLTTSLDDPRVWLPVLKNYLRSNDQRVLEQIFQTSFKIYVLFEIPDSSHFRFLKLKTEKDDKNEEEGEGEEEEEIGQVEAEEEGVESSLLHEEKEEVEEERVMSFPEKGTVEDGMEENQHLENGKSSNGNVEKGRMDPLPSSPTKRHSMIHTSSLETDAFNHRSRSLDSGQGGGSPLKKSQESVTMSAILPTTLFIDTPSSNNSKPPIPLPPGSSSSSTSSPRGGRPTLDALRVALQSDPQTQGTNKSKGKKKNFFGWRSSS